MAVYHVLYRGGLLAMFRWLKRSLIARVVAVSIFALASGLTYAQTSPDIPLEKVMDIKAQPLAVLAKFPEAGPAMARFIAKLLVGQPSVVDAILSIIPDTSPQQASAIGAGLIRAVRAMGRDQSATVRAIVDKVMHSDNLWLKTTFGAIGRSNGMSGTLVQYELIPPGPLGGASVGSALAEGYGRVGRREDVVSQGGNNLRKVQRCSSRVENSEMLECRGMIVALVLSDAANNGAVSTSPTH